jgi:hypothetical protein
MGSTAFLDKVPKGWGFKAVPDPSEFDFNAWNGRLLVYEDPDPTATYVVGVDPSGGKGADRSVIEVIRVGDKHRPDEQVAEFASDFHGPHDLAPVAAMVGRLYGDGAGGEALIIVECNGEFGDSCLFDLRSRLAYGNLFIWKIYDKTKNLQTTRLGWWTTPSTRPKLIARGHHALVNGDLIINSEHLLDELEDFQGDLFMSKAQAISGRHDDRVMSFLMAYWAGHDNEWMAGFDMAAERKRLKAAGKMEQAHEEEASQKVSWQNTAVTYEEMMDQWDSDNLD